MKRLEKVYQQLVNNWENVNEEIILEEQGSSATELAETLGITRANASLELNNLVRQKRAIKIKSYPVRYFPISVLEGLANCRLRLSTYEVSKIQEVLISKAHTPLVVRNPFELMIGQNGILKRIYSFGVDDHFSVQGSIDEILKDERLDMESFYQKVKEIIDEKREN